jgi:hypothetical protein
MGEEAESRLAASLAEQLTRRRANLAAGARRVGGKLGMGRRESIGGDIAVGYLTSATVLDRDIGYSAADGQALHVDAEAALQLGRDVKPADDAGSIASAIARYGAAAEVVDLTPLPGEPESVVADNVFHRAARFASLHSAAPSVNST